MKDRTGIRRSVLLAAPPKALVAEVPHIGYAVLTNSANGPRVVEALEGRIFGLDLRR